MNRTCCMCGRSTRKTQAVGDIYIFNNFEMAKSFGFDVGIYECYNAPYVFENGISTEFYEKSLSKISDKALSTGHLCCDCGAEMINQVNNKAVA